MESFESKKIVPNLEINVGGGAEQQEVLARLVNGYSTMFILTKKFDLHLGAGSHGDIRRRSDIEWDNQLAVGVVRLKNNKISVDTYDKISEEVESAIKEAVNIFLAS